jgi:hypothetical protein
MAFSAVNSTDFAKQLILSELRKRQKSTQESISKCEEVIANPVHGEDFDDYYEHLGAIYELERDKKIKRFVDEMIFTMGSKRECNGEGYFLDCTCTCPTDRSYIRTRACKPCSDRITSSLEYTVPLRRITRSWFKSRSACACEYCYSHSGKYLDDLEEEDYVSFDCKCYETKSLQDMCIPCLLKFTSDQMRDGKLW